MGVECLDGCIVVSGNFLLWWLGVMLFCDVLFVLIVWSSSWICAVSMLMRMCSELFVGAFGCSVAFMMECWSVVMFTARSAVVGLLGGS